MNKVFGVTVCVALGAFGYKLAYEHGVRDGINLCNILATAFAKGKSNTGETKEES